MHDKYFKTPRFKFNGSTSCYAISEWYYRIITDLAAVDKSVGKYSCYKLPTPANKPSTACSQSIIIGEILSCHLESTAEKLTRWDT